MHLCVIIAPKVHLIPYNAVNHWNSAFNASIIILQVIFDENNVQKYSTKNLCEWNRLDVIEIFIQCMSCQQIVQILFPLVLIYIITHIMEYTIKLDSETLSWIPITKRSVIVLAGFSKNDICWSENKINTTTKYQAWKSLNLSKYIKREDTWFDLTTKHSKIYYST